MSSPELEKFEVTEDDFMGAFNPERKKFKMSKNQAIYGSWVCALFVLAISVSIVISLCGQFISW